jgi:hypothetical protein
VTIRETTEVLSRVGEQVTFEMRYQFPDEVLVSRSELRFLPKEAIEGRLLAAELQVEALFGNWDSSPFDAAVSKEMIFIVRPVEPAAHSGSNTPSTPAMLEQRGIAEV